MPRRTPDPVGLQRLQDELKQQLVERKTPTIKQVQEALSLRGHPIPYSSVGKILNCDPCPELDDLLAVVNVLGGDEKRFERLWKDIHGYRGGPGALRVERGQCTGHLTSPEAGATVGGGIQVEGIVQAIPVQHHVWISHQIHAGGLFWAKDAEVTPDAEGRFQRTVFGGGSSKEFSILLLLASEAGHVQLSEWMKEGRFPGIPQDPGLFVELDRVPVHFDPSKD